MQQRIYQVCIFQGSTHILGEEGLFRFIQRTLYLLSNVGSQHPSQQTAPQTTAVKEHLPRIALISNDVTPRVKRVLDV